jgi:hypothetical protein
MEFDLLRSFPSHEKLALAKSVSESRQWWLWIPVPFRQTVLRPLEVGLANYRCVVHSQVRFRPSGFLVHAWRIQVLFAGGGSSTTVNAISGNRLDWHSVPDMPPGLRINGERAGILCSTSFGMDGYLLV